MGVKTMQGPIYNSKANSEDWNKKHPGNIGTNL